MEIALILMLIISGLLFVGLLLSLGFQPKVMSRLLGFLFLFVGIAGILFYGYGYYVIFGPTPKAVMRTLFSVFCMFIGRNEISAIASVPAYSSDAVQAFIYFFHLIALYLTASTVAAGVGTRLIRTLSLMLLHHQKVSLIYGVNDDSLRFAEKLRSEKCVVVLIGDSSALSYDNRILKSGWLLFSDPSLQKPGALLLKRLGVRSGRKQLAVYCLDPDGSKNLRFAEEMQAALKEAGIEASRTRVTLLTEEESAGVLLQASSGESGFGSVTLFSRNDLLARLLIRVCPPWSTMRFTKEGRADENFEALIVGFGQTGQAVLRSLICNGQFVGSRFHALIIANDYSRQAGRFISYYGRMLEEYEIDFREDNARSVAVYRYLAEHVRELNMVVICTGSDSENAEIAREYRDFLAERESRAVLLQVSPRGVTSFSGDDGLPDTADPYTPEILDNGMDEMAKIINHRYHLDDGRSLEEDWADCDYFSRMSCRASADYRDAFVTMAGLDAEELKTNGFPDDPALMENLAETEHLRWTAFHYTMGYRPMPGEVFEARAARYREEMESRGKSSLKVAKDSEGRLHACMIPWDELPELSRREKELTGRDVDYKQLDRDNIRMIPSLLEADEDE